MGAVIARDQRMARNVNLCTITDIRLLYDKATGVTSYQTR